MRRYIEINEEDTEILLQISNAFGHPQDRELTNEQRIEIAINLLVASYDSQMNDSMNLLREESTSADNLKTIIHNVLEAQIATPFTINPPQSDLFK